MHGAHLPVVVLLVALGGCQGSEDPTQAGFLDGIANQLDGTYDRRLKARQAERRSLESANAALETQVASLAAQHARNEARIDQARSRLTDLDRRIATLRARYALSPDTRTQELAQLAEAEDAVVLARAELDRTDAASPGAEAVAARSLQRADELARVIALLPE